MRLRSDLSAGAHRRARAVARASRSPKRRSPATRRRRAPRCARLSTRSRPTRTSRPSVAVNMLRWAEPEPVTDEPWWWQWVNALARWFRGLFGWLAESGRYVVWVLGALLAALLVDLRRAARARSRVAARAEAVRARRVTSATSTFVPRACPTTSVPQRSRSGSAASSARRSRCCIAARCRASCTCTACRSARRPRRANASRSRGRGSRRRARVTSRGSSRRGRAAVYGGLTPAAGAVAGAVQRVRRRARSQCECGMKRPSSLTDPRRGRARAVRRLDCAQHRMGRGQVADAAARRRRDEPVLRGAAARRNARVRPASGGSRWATRAPTPSSCSRRGAGTSTTRGARSSSGGSKPAAGSWSTPH